jgi:hypothetical protein
MLTKMGDFMAGFLVSNQPSTFDTAVTLAACDVEKLERHP